MAVITDEDVLAYHRDGMIMVPNVLEADMLARLRKVMTDLVAASANTTVHTDVYDLEPGHSPHDPRVRRIKAPHKVDKVFMDIIRSAVVVEILQRLLGPNIRLHGSKLNLKSAQYGSPVEWHQDWAFYPHTNDDILAVGVLLNDTDLSNGPLLITPGSHKGPVYSHHGEDGRFQGLIDPELIKNEIQQAVPCIGKAGSMSFHHVRAVHGSAQNTSTQSRNLLLYEVAASDAWPIMGVTNYDDFQSRVLAGERTLSARMKSVPIRLPLPGPLRAGSIYETQSTSKKSYFQQTK